MNTIIISPDPELAGRLENALGSLDSDIVVSRKVDRYPAVIDLVRTLRAHAPEVVFLSFEDVQRAIDLVGFLEGEAAGVQVIAIHRVCDAPLLRETMRAGVREFLADPFDLPSVGEALGNVRAMLARKPPNYERTDQIFSFLPSKAGVGCTTLALNLSAAMARNESTKVLLTDLDLNSGMIRFLLKLDNSNSVIDAVEHSSDMDESLWPQLVTTKGNLDVLHAGPVNPSLRLEPAHVRELTHFMRRNYEAACFDLSGNLERYSVEVMHESKRIFLVCTPEIPSLHLAKEKLTFLRTQGLESRVSLLLNRMTRRPLFSADHVSQVLGIKVMATFSNDYQAINEATTEGRSLSPDTIIGKQCADFAATMLDLRPVETARRKKFLEYFAVPTGVPVRE